MPVGVGFGKINEEKVVWLEPCPTTLISFALLTHLQVQSKEWKVPLENWQEKDSCFKIVP